MTNMKFIPYSCQDINDDDIEAVVSVLKSDFPDPGPAIDNFEELLASYCNANNADRCVKCDSWALSCL